MLIVGAEVAVESRDESEAGIATSVIAEVGLTPLVTGLAPFSYYLTVT
jgi:hypothetical protein